MPLPLLFIGAAAATGALGIGKSIKAAVDMKDAKETNELAQDIIDRSVKNANDSRKWSGEAIEALGERKIKVLDTSMNSFISAFEKLHNVELSESVGLNELNKFRLDKQGMVELKEMGEIAATLAGGVVSGAAAGTLAAVGAYGGATVFGAASTGTAIATLSGAAATNATLAFFGGGSLAAGGLGVAGGAAVLGGLVAGPALAVMGFVVGAKASASRDEAYANYSKAKEYQEELNTVRSLCTGIRLRANMFERLLLKLDGVFQPLIYSLEQIIDQRGVDFSQFLPEEKAVVAAAMSVAGAIKAVLNTPILTEDGMLTDESCEIPALIQPVFETVNGN